MSEEQPQSDVPRTLDPEDWEAARQTAHTIVDDMVDYLMSIRDRPAWRSVPDDAKAAIQTPVPRQGETLANVYETFKNHVLPYPTGNLHPGFFGWVMGNGSLTGALADALASTMNAHLAGYDQSAYFVERQVIRWLAELVDFPVDASGVLVSGGTMANLNGLAVARNEKCGFDIRNQGLQATDAPRLAIYGSTETHSWIYKACELMGLGRQAFRKIPVNAALEIDVQACRRQIVTDIEAGWRPFCVIGNAGTVNTAAIDDLKALRQICDDYDLWLHVDGAFGSLAAWHAETAPLVAGQETADSIAFDLHKWGYMPYDIGCVLTRRSDAQDNTFATAASYLGATKRGLAVQNTYFADKGIQLSRSFRALKAWMCLKEQGTDLLGSVIARNVRQAKYLGERVAAHDKLELMAPVSLNIVCLRYVDTALNAQELDALNEEILLRIQESGSAVPSQTQLHDRFAIRVCITNHRTTQSDLDALLESVVRFGDAITT
ncbi:MAG: pyridoxal-dependent decarboxylase [Pseudomonadota bacterium]